MTTKFQEYDVFNLIDEEQGSETNALVSALAGVASGLIKVPEGVISLGAELIDLGFDTNTAAKVEKAFDAINVFEDVADDRAIGRLTETLVQIGIPGTVGFKLASGAVKAKKAGNYANLTSPNVTRALNKTNDLNKKARRKRFVAGVAGGAAGEAFVADVEDIGSIGDAFETGPTQLTEVTDEGGREDAGRKLLYRV